MRAAIRRRKAAEALPVLPASSRPKVGIVWAGSPTYANDHHRSCALRAFTPLLRMLGIAFYSLQKGEQSQELAILPPEVVVQDVEPLLQDFGDTAVIIDKRDLVITVDTAVAHVAGALGKEVWILLSAVPDWRWRLEGERTPWYPTMRLFRQTARGDWTGVVARVKEALSTWAQMGIVGANAIQGVTLPIVPNHSQARPPAEGVRHGARMPPTVAR